MLYPEFNEIIRKRLDDYRYKHSLAVADEAVKLAEKYGADKNRAYLAGLLHDITKNDSYDNHLKIFKEFGIILTELENNAPNLWHAMSGAAYVQYVLNIDDADVVSAIRYHTTAKAGMTLLQKIIYLADFTSSDRNYPDVDIMRSLAESDMDAAILYAVKLTINKLTKANTAIHPDTFEAYNNIVNSKKSI